MIKYEIHNWKTHSTRNPASVQEFPFYTIYNSISCSFVSGKICKRFFVCACVCTLVLEADKEFRFENCQDSMCIRWQGNAAREDNQNKIEFHSAAYSFRFVKTFQ